MRYLIRQNLNITILAADREMSFMEADEKYLRRVRYISYTLFGEVATMTLTDKKVFITSTNKESYALIVESSEQVNLMKIIWHSTWESADLK